MLLPNQRPVPYLLSLTAALLVMASAGEVLALDYDRNDVLGRELALGVAVLPVEGHPLGPFVRGTARRHTRALYFGGEAQLGATGQGPWVTVAATVGGETAQDAWAPLRGYGEFGTQLMYAGTSVFDTLGFFLEGGMRYQVRTYERPHLQLGIGVRAVNNMQRTGFSAQFGVSWLFD